MHLQLLGFGANFCCPATTVAEFFSCTTEKFHSSATTRAERYSPDKSAAVLLPQLQNVSHQRNILQARAECFSQEKNSALLLPQNNHPLLFCYHNVFQQRNNYSAVLLPQGLMGFFLLIIMLQVQAASCTSTAACTFSIPSPPSCLKLRILI